MGEGSEGETTHARGGDRGELDGQPQKPISYQSGKAAQPIGEQFSNGLPNRKAQEAGRAAGAGDGKR